MRATGGFGEVAGGCAEEGEVAGDYICGGSSARRRKVGPGGNKPVTASRTEGFAVVSPADRRDCAAATRKSEKNNSWSLMPSWRMQKLFCSLFFFFVLMPSLWWGSFHGGSPGVKVGGAWWVRLSADSG